jgi:hypothetical protein
MTPNCLSDARISALVHDFYAEAQALCGSEGMFQNLFHHHALRHFPDALVRREVAVPSGNIDFVIAGHETSYAIELKAGANGHRNSLGKMKENGLDGNWQAPRLVMVVTDSDPRLASGIAELKRAYGKRAALHWSGAAS